MQLILNIGSKLVCRASKTINACRMFFVHKRLVTYASGKRQLGLGSRTHIRAELMLRHKAWGGGTQ
jgi:hypothetical protein